MAGSLSLSACAKDRFDEQSLRRNPVGDFGTGCKLEIQIIDDAPVKHEYREAPVTMRYPDVPEQSPAPPDSVARPAYSVTRPEYSGATFQTSPKGDFGSSAVNAKAKLDDYWTHHAPAEKPPEAPASVEICPCGDFGDGHIDVREVLKDHWSRGRDRLSGKQPWVSPSGIRPAWRTRNQP